MNAWKHKVAESAKWKHKVAVGTRQIEDDTDRLFNRKNKDVELFQIRHPVLEAFFQPIFNSDYNLFDLSRVEA